MNREKLEELAALHALGMLEDEELRAFQEELRSSPEAQQLVGELTAAADSIAFSVDQVEPPAELGERILAALPEQLPAMEAKVSSPPTKGPVSIPFHWLPWSIAAALVVVCTSLVNTNQQLHQEVALLERQSAIDSLRIAMLTSLVESSPNATGVAVWNTERQEGVLTIDQLPAAPADQDYQLWLIDPQYENPVSAGVFNPTPDGQFRYDFRASLPIASANVFAVSIEAKGGSETPQGTIILASSGL